MPKAEVGVWPLYTDLGSHSTNQCPCKLSIYFKLAPLATTERFCFCIKICGGKKKYVMGQEKKKKRMLLYCSLASAMNRFGLPGQDLTYISRRWYDLSDMS